MVLVIAGTYAEFQHYIRACKAQGATSAALADLRYVERESDLRGYRDAVVCFVGQWWKNPAQALAHDLIAAGVLRRNLDPSALFGKGGEDAPTVHPD